MSGPTGRSRFLRGRWSGPLLLVATLALLLLVLEAGFRLVQAWHPPAPSDEIWAVADPELGYRNRPNWRDHDRHGLRGGPGAETKTGSRLLLVGDSVLYYGRSPADTLPGRVATHLNARPENQAVEVLNAGTRGYTNFQETRWILRDGFALDPDLIGIVFVMNDLHRFLHRFEVEDGEIVRQKYYFAQEAVDTVESPLYRLARKSHFLVWLRRHLGVFDALVDLYAGGGFSFEYRPDFAPAWRSEPWRDVEVQLAEVVGEARRRGVGVFLVAVPFGPQLDPDVANRDPEFVTFPQRQLTAIASRLELPFLDLLSHLEATRDFERDGIHLNAAGRDRAAARMAEFIERNGLVPATGEYGR